MIRNRPFLARISAWPAVSNHQRSAAPAVAFSSSSSWRCKTWQTQAQRSIQGFENTQRPPAFGDETPRLSPSKNVRPQHMLHGFDGTET